MNNPAALQELIRKDGIIVVPGAYDCLSAQLVQHAGFEALALGGAGLLASGLGAADLGQSTMAEMVNWVRAIVEAVEVPVLADAEAGFGGVVNVMRTVRSLERAGVAGLFLEDQAEYRAAGAFTTKQVVPLDEMVMKIKSAVKARENPDLALLIRTDALTIEGLPAAITRARAYAEAGADSLFIIDATTREQLAEVAESLGDLGLPLRANVSESSSAPQVSVKELEQLGYKFAHFQGICLRVAITAMSVMLNDFKKSGDLTPYYSMMTSSAERNELLGFGQYLSLEEELLNEQ